MAELKAGPTNFRSVLQDAAKGLGIESRRTTDFIDKFLTAADFIPGVSAIASADRAGDEVNRAIGAVGRGDYGKAAEHTGMMGLEALGALPFGIGPMMKRGTKAMKGQLMPANRPEGPGEMLSVRQQPVNNIRNGEGAWNDGDLRFNILDDFDNTLVGEARGNFADGKNFSGVNVSNSIPNKNEVQMLVDQKIIPQGRADDIIGGPKINPYQDTERLLLDGITGIGNSVKSGISLGMVKDKPLMMQIMKSMARSPALKNAGGNISGFRITGAKSKAKPDGDGIDTYQSFSIPKLVKKRGSSDNVKGAKMMLGDKVPTTPLSELTSVQKQVRKGRALDPNRIKRIRNSVPNNQERLSGRALMSELIERERRTRDMNEIPF
jgi:hypothetical protein